MINQIYDSIHGDLKEVTLISSTGKSVDIKALVQEFVLIEDIFLPYLAGELLIKDAPNVLVATDMHGNEYIHVVLETPTIPPIDKYFRVYSVSDVHFQNATSMSYTIHLCSEEFILNQQMLISKSYRSLRNDEIISDVLKNKLKVPENRINFIEKTNGQEDIVVPNMRPFELINWVSSYSINSRLGSAFLFFESMKGYTFVSLETMFKQNTYKTIEISPKNLNTENDKSIDNKFKADLIEILTAFDVAQTISTGGYSSNMLKLDILRYKYEDKPFNIITNNFLKLNNQLPINDAKNRLEKSLASGSGYMRYFPSFQGDLTDKWLLQRASQLSLLNSFRARINISGDPGMPVGSIIELDFPLIQPTDTSSKSQKDLYKSGRYLVTRIKHRVVDRTYTNSIEIAKDSSLAPFPSAITTNNQLYNQAKKS